MKYCYILLWFLISYTCKSKKEKKRGPKYHTEMRIRIYKERIYNLWRTSIVNCKRERRSTSTIKCLCDGCRGGDRHSLIYGELIFRLYKDTNTIYWNSFPDFQMLHFFGFFFKASGSFLNLLLSSEFAFSCLPNKHGSHL